MNAAIRSDLDTLLIVCPSWVGDTVMATPVLRAARRHLPGARIVVATRPGLDALLAGAPWIDELITVQMRGMLGPVRAAGIMKRHRPDAILLLPNSLRSGLTAWLAGAPVRVGYDRDGRGKLLTHRLAVERDERPTPTIAYYGRLVTFAFGDASPDLTPELAVSDDEDAAADRLLAGVDGPFALLTPGGNKTPKRWPADRFARVADQLHAEHGLRLVASGSPSEHDVIRAVITAADTEIVDLVERGIDLRGLKAVARRAAIMVTNDTGPRHVAAALGTPIVSLFGPTDHRWTTLDAANEHLLLAEPFLPEDQVADRHPKACEIGRIPVADVLSAARRLLASGRASEEGGLA